MGVGEGKAVVDEGVEVGCFEFGFWVERADVAIALVVSVNYDDVGAGFLGIKKRWGEEE